MATPLPHHLLLPIAVGLSLPIMQQQEEDDLELSPEALAALAEFAVQVSVWKEGAP